MVVWQKLLSQFNRFLGVVVAAALSATMLTVPANAAEVEGTSHTVSRVSPSEIVLEHAEGEPGKFVASTDIALESDRTLFLYEEGNPHHIATSTSENGVEHVFEEVEKKPGSSYYATEGAVESNTIMAPLNVPTLSLTISSPVYATDDTPEIDWEASFNMTSSGYSVYIVDITNDSVKSVRPTGSTGSFLVPKQKSGNPITYQGFIAESGSLTNIKKLADLVDIQAESNTVTASRKPWTVSASAEFLEFSTADRLQPPIIDWTLNQPLSLTDYSVYLWNETEDAVVSVQSNFGTTGYRSIKFFGSGEPRTYKVVVAKTGSLNNIKTYADFVDIQAVSQPLTFSRKPWDVSLTRELKSVGSNGNKLMHYRYTANQNIYYSDYQFYMVDSLTGMVVSTMRPNDHTGLVSRTELNGVNYASSVYVAKRDTSKPTPTHVSELEEIQAYSELVVTNDVNLYSKNKRSIMGGGNPGNSSCKQTCIGDPVNALTGEFFENVSDLSVNSILPFSFGRSFSTLNKDISEDFGNGWRHNYRLEILGDASTLQSSQNLTVEQENGSTVAFLKLNTGEYAAGGSVNATLSYDPVSQTYAYSRDSLTEYIFSNTGRLIEWVDNNDNSMEFTYNSNNKLSQVFSSDGAILTITWSTSGDRIVEVSDGIQTVDYEYSPAGNLAIVESTHKHGLRQYVYDPLNRITRVIHENGGIWLNEYDSTDRVSKQTDAEGNETLFSYQETTSGHETTITHPDLTQSRQKYDREGNLLTQTFALGTAKETVFTNQYDGLGRKIKESGPSGTIGEYTYDERGNLKSSTDALNRTTSYTYNNNNQLVETVNPLDDVATNFYDSSGNLIKIRSYEGKETTITYTPEGLIETILSSRALADNALTKKTSYTYDNRGNTLSATSPEGGTVSVEYNSSGLPTKLITPDLAEETYYYDSKHQLNRIVNPDLTENTITYDFAGQVIETVDELGRTAEYEYDLLGNEISRTTAFGTTETTYDIMNRPVLVSNYDGTEVEYEYDLLGNLISLTDSVGASNYEYYPNGMMKKAIDAAGKETEYVYNAVGSITKVILPNNEESRIQYDELNRVIRSEGSNGYYETYTYTKDDLLASKKAAGLFETTYEYDDDSNLTKITNPDSSTELFGYNYNDSVISYTNRDGQTTTNERNSQDQVIRTVRPDSSTISYSYNNMGDNIQISFDDWATVAKSYEYNANGQIASVSKGTSQINYVYDALGQLLSRGPPGVTEPKTEYTYTSHGELSTVQYPSGDEVEYLYNTNGTLSEVKLNDITVADYSYNNLGLLTETEYSNGVKEEYSYDQLNLPTQTKVKKGFSTYWEEDLTRDGAGLILSNSVSAQSSPVKTTEYGYDEKLRLQTASDITTSQIRQYSHDSSNNLLSSPARTNTHTPNGSLLTSSTGATDSSYLYDLRGNRLSEVEKITASNSNSITKTYTWDELNTLTQISQLDHINNTTAETEYQHDATGLLSKKTQTFTDGTNTTSEEEEYQWDTNSALPLLIEDGNNVYVYGLDSSPFLQIDKISNEKSFLHHNTQGSVTALTDEDGDLSWTKEYDEYGEEITQTPNSGQTQTETPFAYVGEYLDNDTGLYNLRARWYEPKTGSFLSADPLQSYTGEAYSYGSGDPRNHRDPTGLFSFRDALSGAADSITGLPIASTMANAINPGSVSTCSSSYMAGMFIGIGLSFLPWFSFFAMIKLIHVWIKMLNFWKGLDKAEAVTKVKSLFSIKKLSKPEKTSSEVPIVRQNYLKGKAYEKSVRDKYYPNGLIDNKMFKDHRRYPDIIDLGTGRIIEVKNVNVVTMSRYGEQLKKDIAIVADPNIPEITQAVWHIHPRAKVDDLFMDYARKNNVIIVQKL